jgi:enoyl-CoA hydratase/carnithine racemase
MFEELAKIASVLYDDKNIRAVIVSGSGKSFCTGKLAFENHESPNRFVFVPVIIVSVLGLDIVRHV